MCSSQRQSNFAFIHTALDTSLPDPHRGRRVGKVGEQQKLLALEHERRLVEGEPSRRRQREAVMEEEVGGGHDDTIEQKADEGRDEADSDRPDFGLDDGEG